MQTPVLSYVCSNRSFALVPNSYQKIGLPHHEVTLREILRRMYCVLVLAEYRHLMPTERPFRTALNNLRQIKDYFQIFENIELYFIGFHMLKATSWMLGVRHRLIPWRALKTSSRNLQDQTIWVHKAEDPVRFLSWWDLMISTKKWTLYRVQFVSRLSIPWMANTRWKDPWKHVWFYPEQMAMHSNARY